jgi:hypothetical protein
MSSARNTKREFVSTKKANYGLYKEKKNRPANLKGKGDIYMDPKVLEDKEEKSKEMLENAEVEFKEMMSDEAKVENCPKENVHMVNKEINEMFNSKNLMAQNDMAAASKRERMDSFLDDTMDKLALGKKVQFTDVADMASEINEKIITSVELTGVMNQMNRQRMMLEVMEEKAHMEANINTKMEWDDMRKKSKMLDSYLDMKKSMMMVMEFMSSVVKEEVVTMRHKENSSKATSSSMTKMSQELFDKNEKLSIYSSKKGVCKCTDCRIKNMMHPGKSTTHKLASMKTCMLSDNIKMEISADEEKFSVYASKKKENSRNISMLEKKNNKMVMDIELSEMDDRIWETDEFDFSIGAFVNMYNLELEKNITVSYSSQVLVSWIRLMDLDLSRSSIVVQDENKSESYDADSDIPNGSCFSNMLKHFIGDIMPDLKENMMFFAMSELPAWLEMKFLSMVGKHHVYVRYTSKEDMHNHISIKRFKGAIKIKAYMLSIPMFRNIKWFMDENKEGNSPEFHTWLESQKNNREKMVLSMLNQMVWKHKVDVIQAPMRIISSDHVLWKIAINFDSYEEMLDKIYSVEMKELDNFYKKQLAAIQFIKDEVEEDFLMMMKKSEIYSETEIMVATLTEFCMDSQTHYFENGTSLSRSEAGDYLMEDMSQFYQFFFSSLVMFVSIQRVITCMNNFSKNSTLDFYVKKLNIMFLIIKKINMRTEELINKEDIEDIQMWKRKQPVGLQNVLESYDAEQVMMKEFAEASLLEADRSNDEREDLGPEADHNMD